MKKTVLINASNLHVGGGIQVASSFIFELSRLLNDHSVPFDITILCSEKVYQNLPTNFDSSVFYRLEVLNLQGSSFQPKKVKNKFSGFDICFTVFGPLYFTPNVKKHICGFAQPWIAYPDNIAYKKLTFKEYLKNKIKFRIQSLLFKRYDFLVVEQNHVKDALSKLHYTEDNIIVVSNCLSSIYEYKDSWLPLTLDSSLLVEDITLGFIGRPYPHKNISVLNEVNKILIAKYKMRCNFLFTFSESEMKSCGLSGNSNFLSVGEIMTAQCPSFYNHLDALLFPSLLECFSASPIEAMKMNTTVIASDFPFVNEVCGEGAFYFDPLSADDIAKCIFNTFSNKELREYKKKLANQLVQQLPSARDRAISYLNMIKDNI